MDVEVSMTFGQIWPIAHDSWGDAPGYDGKRPSAKILVAKLRQITYLIFVSIRVHSRFNNHHPPIISFASSFEIPCSIFDIPHLVHHLLVDVV